jgi:hypothetical protein
MLGRGLSGAREILSFMTATGIHDLHIVPGSLKPFWVDFTIKSSLDLEWL